MSRNATLIDWPKYDPKPYRFAIPNAVCEHKLKPIEFVIFSYFCYWHSRTLVNTPTLESVAEGVHVTTGTVKKNLAGVW